MHQLDKISELISKHCNVDGDSLPIIRRRVRETLSKGTYLVRYHRDKMVGYVDYDITHDGIVHVRKLIALQPGLITDMVNTLKRTLPWKRMFCYRAKYQAWHHHRRIHT